MEDKERKENLKSTPVETPKEDQKYHVNQSTEESQKSNYGMIAIIVIAAIIVLGLLFFSDLWV
ncbi:hypothetical protein GCM10007103_25080 [Salinimicrobium marinum]|uniref:Uncharacterized protein n=1 Tax=Salinimicrobium marinum TaxID=680283 RepID=A0A918W023_9FLAO|nr:hypothetical protein [Salinimicrobium marinum]GHA42906.1 hypothetical protein GCM10007103_25080 [Salinimicrobium marinum]